MTGDPLPSTLTICALTGAIVVAAPTITTNTEKGNANAMKKLPYRNNHRYAKFKNASNAIAVKKVNHHCQRLDLAQEVKCSMMKLHRRIHRRDREWSRKVYGRVWVVRVMKERVRWIRMRVRRIINSSSNGGGDRDRRLGDELLRGKWWCRYRGYDVYCISVYVCVGKWTIFVSVFLIIWCIIQGENDVGYVLFFVSFLLGILNLTRNEVIVYTRSVQTDCFELNLVHSHKQVN